MSYLAQARLGDDLDFGQRTRSVISQQSQVFINDARPDLVALSRDLLKEAAQPTRTFILMLAGAPGFVDTADPVGNGEIDSSRITDADLLAAAQAGFPTVASLFFDADGNRFPD